MTLEDIYNFARENKVEFDFYCSPRRTTMYITMKKLGCNIRKEIYFNDVQRSGAFALIDSVLIPKMYHELEEMIKEYK